MDSDNIIQGGVRVKQRYIEGRIYTRKRKKSTSNTISTTRVVENNNSKESYATSVSDRDDGVGNITPDNVSPTRDGIDNVANETLATGTVAVATASANGDDSMSIVPVAAAPIVITGDNGDANVDLSATNAIITTNNDENLSLMKDVAAAAAATTTAEIEEKDDDNDKSSEKNTAQVHDMQLMNIDDTNLGQRELSSRPEATLNNSSSLNRQPDDVTLSTGELVAVNGRSKQRLENGNLKSRSKQELREQLESDLDMVRSWVRRIEDTQGQLGGAGFGNSRVSINNGVSNGARSVSLELSSLGVPRESTTPISTPTPRKSRPFDQLRVSLMDNSQGLGEIVEKEKRTPKANQLYRNSEFLLAKDKFPPAESNKKQKVNGKKHGGGDLRPRFSPGSKVYKNCSSLLDKLMKHKHGWVFNTPVDVVALGLHDYFTIIRHPMDLGTVKSKLHKHVYKSPEEFAEDVKLTFHNALRYNPEGQDVHIMADILLKIFEDRWAVIKSDYDRELVFAASYHGGYPTPRPFVPPLQRPPPLDMRRILDRSDSVVSHSVDVRTKPISITPSSRTPAPKKPKAKDPNKRDMTYEEKQKLSTNLQNLPSEKLDSIVQIVKKRNSAVSQHDDEIEVDIDRVDVETLWELDRFVTNYKKNLSKHKRKAELAMQARAEAEKKAQEKAQAPPLTNESRAMEIDERNVPTSSPVQLEKRDQADNRSQSSSSSSSSSTDSGSSSSDSDSESSSASGSDVGQ